MKSVHPIHYYCNVYKKNYYIYNRWTPQAFNKYMRRYLTEDIDLSCVHGKCITNGDIIHVYTRNDSKPSILVHECIHAAAMTLNQVGIDFTNDHAEALCYLTESIYRFATGEK